MKAIMVMFDTLNRHMLPPYGCEWVHFSREHLTRPDGITTVRRMVSSRAGSNARARNVVTKRSSYTCAKV